MRHLIALYSILFFPLSLHAAELTGRCVAVTDGDTIQVMRERRAEKVRLYGIDCPEKRQPFGQAAKKFTSRAAFGRDVTVTVVDVDRYGRTVGRVRLPDGRILNDELVRAGMAWWYSKYAPNDANIEALEREARAARRGLWADANPVEPWRFRKKK